MQPSGVMPMDPPETFSAAQSESALNSAVRALHNGDQRAARQWARQAVASDPQVVEAWLILAQVSGPHARIAYLEQALKAQPDNPALIEVLRQARLNPAERIEPSARLADRADASQPVTRSAKQVLTLLSLVYLLTALVTTAVLWLVFPQGISQARAMDVAAAPVTAGSSDSAASSDAAASTAAVADPLKIAAPAGTPFPIYTNTPTQSPSLLPTETASPAPLPTETPVIAHLAAATTAAEAGVTVPTEGKWILVSIAEQRVYAYDGDQLVFDFAASTGRNNLTPPGSFRILDKIPNAYSDLWGFWMPNWMGITWVGSSLENGFHSLPVLANGQEIWGDALGTPVTYGCVVLGPDDMKQLYDWAEVGTPVVIVPLN